MKNTDIEYKTFKMKVKDIDKEKNIVVGYASAYGNVDHGGDIIQKGAFNKSIQENGPNGRDRILYLENHKMSEEPLGKVIKFEEDEYGLKFYAKIADTEKGRTWMSLIKGGVITENSIGFNTVKADYDEKGNRVIKEGMLWEVSAVNIAMNEKAIIMDAKGMVDQDKLEEELKKYDALSDLVRKGNLNEEMTYHIASQIKQLKYVLKSVITQPTEEVTEPTMQEEVVDEAKTLEDIAGEILKGIN